MPLAKRSHFHRTIVLSVSACFGTMVVATIVINTFHPGQPGAVLSQTATPSTAQTSPARLNVNEVSSAEPDASSGLKRVTVKLTVENTGTDTLQLSPGLQMFLRSGDGRQHNLTMRYMAPGLVIGGPLAADAKTDLILDFDLPAASAPSEFIYQPDAGSQPSIVKL